jgi:hypothetical protein
MRILLIALACLGCGETEECAKLRALLAEHERVRASMKARVALEDQTQKRLDRVEAKAKETMSSLGLDLPESKLAEELDARVRMIPGATIERTTRMVADSMGSAQEGASETLWRIHYSAKSTDEALALAERLWVAPPVFRVATVIDEGKGKWLIELFRASVIEVPMNVAPTPIPMPAGLLEAIPSELGFCGAGDLRAQITGIQTELAALKEKAEALSVLLPKVATYEGLERRAALLGEEQAENRRLLGAYAGAVKASKVRFKAMGVERAVVVYELYGRDADRAKLEKHLPKDVVEGIKPLESATKGVLRLSVTNRVVDQQLKRAGGAMRPGVGLAPGNP